MVFEKLPTRPKLNAWTKQDPSPGTLYNEKIELSIIALPLQGKFGTAVDCWINWGWKGELGSVGCSCTESLLWWTWTGELINSAVYIFLHRGDVWLVTSSQSNEMSGSDSACDRLDFSTCA
jgi:hypothetical protein